MPKLGEKRAPEDRFWEKVDKTSECWEWKAQLTYQGYGRFYDATRMVRAHRYAYESLIGPIPPGLVQDA